VTQSDTRQPQKPAFATLPIWQMSIFWQILALSLTVLVLALGINTLAVIKAPSPPPSGYTLAEAVTALKGGEVRLQNGRRLRSLERDTPPDFVVHPQPLHGGFRELQPVIRARLAQALNVPEDTIWVNFTPRRDLRLPDRPRVGFDEHPISPNGGQIGGPIGGQIEREAPDEAPFPSPSSAMPPPRSPLPHTPWLARRELGEMVTADTRARILFPAFDAAWKLPDGHYRVITSPRAFIEPWQERLLMGFGLTALFILPLAYWLSQRLARPIIAFSEAASKLSVEDSAPPVLAIGPREVRQAADVLNAMQARIRKQIESRTVLMGAIAHDLKTPLARMRLRIEDLPAELREKLSQDIAHMDALIRSAMSFTSAHKLAEQVRLLDMSALTESLIEDMGVVCRIEAADITPDIMVLGDQVALTRILTNLIENAGRYATSCRVRLRAIGGDAVLSLLDDGPGLPDEALEAVFEPFYRMESSRNRDTGGTGLGLSVARALAEAQGGSLRLHNRYEDGRVIGLEARLILPILLRSGRRKVAAETH
jgi:signal transduction histidine kinase